MLCAVEEALKELQEKKKAKQAQSYYWTQGLAYQLKNAIWIVVWHGWRGSPRP